MSACCCIFLSMAIFETSMHGFLQYCKNISNIGSLARKKLLGNSFLLRKLFNRLTTIGIVCYFE